MRTKISELIKSYLDQKQLVAIFSNRNDINHFSVGYILCFDDESLILHSFDPNGFYDGYYFYRIDNIYLIEMGSKYLDVVNLFISENPTMIYENMLKINIEGDLLDGLLEQCLLEKKLITIKLDCGNRVDGFINKIYDGFLLIDAITSDGISDGMSFFRIEDVELIRIDDLDLRRISKMLQK